MKKIIGLCFMASLCIFSINAKNKKSEFENVDTSSVEEIPEEIKAIAKRNNETYGEKLARTFTKFDSKDKFYEYDSTSVFTTGTAGTIKEREAVVVLNPQTQYAGFGSTYMLAYYYCLMNAEGRKSFINAVNQYHEDFANKKLKRKDNNSTTTYGKIPVRIEWGSFKTSVRNYAETTAYLGYKFVKKSPYFTITIYPTDNQNLPMSLSSDYKIESSMNLCYDMTKAQSKNIANQMDEELINSMLLQYAAAVNNIYGSYTEADSYSDTASDEEAYEEN